ncbi:FG-GAP-like repeat-containing protein [Streptomyces sp. NPDC056480]|uniref:FG-GAP-like repeat-containing protein n=1 Tax=Streptomyces sp. NPDC056480 TaxID=3345833 RepID=UPI0036979FFB
MRTTMSRRRLPVSVGVVLAAMTAASLHAPAVATAVPPPSAAAQQARATAASVEVPFLESGGELLAAGATGFLSKTPDRVVRWTRYADGVSKVIDTSGEAWVTGSATDTVVVVKQVWHRPSIESVTVYDMATGAAPVTIKATDVPELNGDFYGAVGSTLLMAAYDGSALTQVEVRGGTVSARKVAGVPADVSNVWMPSDLPGAALVQYYDGRGGRTGVVDLTTASLVEDFERTREVKASYLAARRVAWTESVDGKPVLATAVRGGGEVERVPLGPDDSAALTGGLVGDWFAFGATTGDATPWHTFTARSLTDGSTVKVLDHAESATQGPDDTLLVLGVTDAHGQGVYRVAVGADGKPEAELVASTGEPNEGATPISYVGDAVPAVIDLDRTPRPRLAWTFSSDRADLSVGFTSKATGERFHQFVRAGSGSGASAGGPLGFDWTGEVRDSSRDLPKDAPNGAYTWSVTALPKNGMPSVSASGTFTVVRKATAHDYDDNGAPDLLARDANGFLDRIATHWDRATGKLVPINPTHTGSRGWGGYDRIESVGDVAGSPAADLVGRDRQGDLWFYQGTGDAGSGVNVASRERVGGGWQIYTQLAGGSDLTGDGRPDLVATDKSGGLWLYKATGKVSAPFAPRKRIGHGWGIYNQLTATGNIGGNPTGDLVARDASGVLWLYLGKGDGTFAPRTRIGGGWNAYADIVGIGDANKDGRPDLYARTPAGTATAFFYAGTGDWKAPFKPRGSTEAGVQEPWATVKYNHVA